MFSCFCQLIDKLIQHTQTSFDAINILYEQKFFEQSIYLSFILIDQLSWLVSKEKQKTGEYFQEWVNTYFIKFYPEITPLEVWGSRNAKLHMNAADSSTTTKHDARKLIFIYEINNSQNLNSENSLEDFYVVNAHHFLSVALKNAVEIFFNNFDKLNEETINLFEKRLSSKFLIRSTFY